MFKIGLDLSKKLYKDIYIIFKNGETEKIDSYHLFSGVIPNNYEIALKSKIESLFVNWIKILNNNTKEEYFFIIDISDEYVGGFFVEVTKKETLKIMYCLLKDYNIDGNYVGIDVNRDKLIVLYKFNEVSKNKFFDQLKLNPCLQISKGTD